LEFATIFCSLQGNKSKRVLVVVQFRYHSLKTRKGGERGQQNEAM
jgi:hypothetical protein